MPDDGGFGFGQFTDEGHQFIGVDAGFLGGPFGGVGLDKVTQGVKVLNPEVDKLCIIEFILDDLVNDGQVEGVIGARPDQEEPTGMGGRLGGPDVDDREFAAVCSRRSSGHCTL